MITDVLNLVWTVRQPGLQKVSSAETLTARVIKIFQGRRIEEYDFIDFCSGSGGPTPMLAEQVNRTRDLHDRRIQFILTDAKPNVPAWQSIAAKNEDVSYVETPVDATDVSTQSFGARLDQPRTFRTFHNCFHHFDDPEARILLRVALQQSDGFG